MSRVLIVDDDKDILNALEIYLTNDGYQVLRAANGREAVERMRDTGAELILMDVMMPQMDGIAATERIRRDSNVPILFLTAKSEDVDLIQGLNIGADDYITKPFKPMEVLARVKSHLRRYTRLGGQQKPNDGILHVGPVTLEDAAKRVTVDGEPVSLTPLEFSILRLLMQHPGQVFSTAQIYERVWQGTALGSENTVAVHIRHLREKIETDPARPRHLKVVWGLGYKMEE